MKKCLIVLASALCIAGSAFAQENAGGNAASNSATGDMNKEKIVAGVVGVGLLAAMVANNRGSAKDPVVIIDPPPVECGAGEELIDGECVPIVTPPPVTVTGTTPVTSTGITTVTVAITTP